MIYLDITRLLSRLDAPTPTGIDRVEFQYAKYALRIRARFVAQGARHVIEVPRWLAQEVIDHLGALWHHGETSASNIQKHVEAWRNMTPVAKVETKVERFFGQLKTQDWRTRAKMIKTDKMDIQKHAGPVPWPLVALGLQIMPGLIATVLAPDKSALTSKSKLMFNQVSGENLYVNVGHVGLDRREILQAIKAETSMQMCFFIHDVLPISHPELFETGVGTKHKTAMQNVQDFADIQVTNSAFTHDAVLQNFPNSRVDGVLEIGISQLTLGAAKSTRRSGFVSIGTIEPRKNFTWLARAWLELCRQNQQMQDETLTIFGKRGWIEDTEFDTLMNLVSTAQNIDYIDTASDAEIAARLSSARAYISAAHVEGWGMPLAESLALGTPVIASDIAAHREATQGNAQFFPRGDEAALQGYLIEHTDETGLQKALYQTQKFQPWRWSTHFKKMRQAVCKSRTQRQSGHQT